MDPLSNVQTGICTICSSVHVYDDDIDGVQKCENCGEECVYSIETLCDMANAYLDSQRESLYDD